jgi:hypothetical protein
VSAGVEEYVRNRIPGLARRPQHADVTAVGEDLPGSPENPIHGPREARHDGLEPTGEIRRTRRFDQQMHVVDLHRVVDHPEAPAFPHFAPASLELGEEPSGPKRGDVPVNPEGDVAGIPSGERRPSPVRIARPGSRLAPGAGSPAAPAR